jgi:filamentous hemagglutinin family protein
MNSGKHRGGRFRKHRLLAAGISVGTLLAGAWASQAQVVLDGKFGTSGALTGPNYSITAAMGATHGNNLFQSFSKFNLSAGDVANFTGPANIRNILCRVTGNGASSIDGTIQSGIAGANFFLINPNGIAFGPNAVLNVSGSVAASTANYLKLSDGAKFVASLGADDSGLSTAPVSAFGFMGGNVGTLSVQQSTLAVQNGQTLSLVGGNLTVDGGIVQAPQGQINAVSVRSVGEVPVDPATMSVAQFNTAFPQQGQIQIQNLAQVDASGDGGGRIVIRGGQITVDNSLVQANTTGVTDGKGIDISALGDLNVVDGGQINCLSTAGLGAGGNITINSQSLNVNGDGVLGPDFFSPATQISTATGDMFNGGGAGKGGDIVIHTGSFTLVDSAQILSATYDFGDAGKIDITASSILIDPMLSPIAQISANSQVFTGTGGNAGGISINTGTLEMKNSALIVATTFDSGQAGRVGINAQSIDLNNSVISVGTFGSGNGGEIQINADSIHITSPIGLPTGIQAVTGSQTDPAPGGNIFINAGTLTLDNFGSIYTTTYGLGTGGNINLQVNQLNMQSSSSILASENADAGGTGNAGKISINSSLNITLNSDSSISTSTTFGSGRNIVINTSLLDLMNGATILAETHGSGSAGLVDVNAQSVNLLSGSSITASTSGAGNGGDIQIGAGILNIDGGSALLVVTTSPDFPAPGGNIRVNAGEINLSQRGSILSGSLGIGPAGNISLNSSGDITLTGGSSVSAAAPGSSGGNISLVAGSAIQLAYSQITAQAGLDGGNITLNAPSLISLLHSTVSGAADTTGSGFGNGGNLAIDPSFLILNDGSLISKSSFGNGGNISIFSDYFFQSASTIDASAPFGLPGTVSVSAPQVDLSGSLIDLPNNLLDAESLLRPDCAVRLAGDVSTFTMLGRGGLPLEPGGFVPSGSAPTIHETK